MSERIESTLFFIKKHVKWWVITLLVVMLSIVSASYAWGTASDSKVNHFNTGSYDFNIGLVDIFDTPKETIVGDKIPKKVSAKNNRNTAGFVRLMVHPKIEKKTPNGIELLPAEIGKQVTLLEGATKEWRAGGDGYFYYVKKVNPGEETLPLFKAVKLTVSDEEQEKYKGSRLSILVKTEASVIPTEDYRLSWWGSKESPSSDSLKEIDKLLQKELPKSNK